MNRNRAGIIRDITTATAATTTTTVTVTTTTDHSLERKGFLIGPVTR